MKIILTGFMCAGKTTNGGPLAAELGYSFADTDMMINEKTGKSIEDIFKFNGESHFRCLERIALHEALERKDDLVLAIGGGTPCFFDNLKYCLSRGILVFLNTPRHILIQRINQSKSHPLFVGVKKEKWNETIDHYMEKRLPFYCRSHITYNEFPIHIPHLAQTIADFQSITN